MFHGRYITFDLTASAPYTNQPLGQLNLIMNHFRANKVKSVLDFGAGNLRNTWPLIDGGFDVWISDFKEQIPEDDASLAKAQESGLQTLIYPTELLKAQIEFDAILLSYVLHILPDAKCRIEVL